MSAAAKSLTISGLLDRYKGQIAAALPKHITPDRMARLALTAVRTNPLLEQADALSLMGAIIRCSQDGLEPGRTAHLVPFRNKRKGIIEVQYIADYRGLIELARRSGEIGVFYAELVRDGDFFEYERGTNEFLRHRPAEGDRGTVLYAYAIAKARDGGWSQFHVMTVTEIEAIRSRSRAAKDGPWVSDWEAMAKKTVARQLCKWLPQSPELRRAVLADELADLGEQHNRRVIDSTAEREAPPRPRAGVEGLLDHMGAQAAPSEEAEAPAGPEEPSDTEEAAEAAAENASEPAQAPPEAAEAPPQQGGPGLVAEGLVKLAREAQSADELDQVEADARDALGKRSKALNEVLDAIADGRRRLGEKGDG